ncbi:hypothetical protein [Streptomyces graminilatus]|uniref:hypothetical protein n=1 Tax=Streptomyces graminilatus TaxID=1464070 RepID=UPI0006E20ECC|nr:hypothetical protein [Streptomyces graminilatus]
MAVVLRAETFYLPPPTMPADAWDRLPAGERALRWTEVHAQRRLPDIPREETAEPLYARVDAGRWLAECGCGCAHVVSPTDPHMLCTVCLDGWHPVTFPPDPAAVEEEVVHQPRRHQFWYHPCDVRWQAERLFLAEQIAAQAQEGDG